jgi:nitroreductase
MLKDLIKKSRSYRRFNQEVEVSEETLRELIDLARLSPSGANRQPLKFITVADRETNAELFECLAWAGYLQNWEGPSEGERPAAYIIILCDTEIREDSPVDEGIAAQSMMLGAVEKGLGGCMLGAINRNQIREILDVPERYKVLLVLALGEPAETVVIDEVGEDGNIKYWRDDEGVHHVPKRPLDELILS